MQIQLNLNLNNDQFVHNKTQAKTKQNREASKMVQIFMTRPIHQIILILLENNTRFSVSNSQGE